MFTGCIRQMGTVSSCDTSDGVTKLSVSSTLACEVELGDSIAINGACLTVEQLQVSDRMLTFHLLRETTEKTTLGELVSGTRVNLERAMCLGDRLDGHLVSGHVDCTARIVSTKPRDRDKIIKIALSEENSALLIAKGSITVDGVSLTVAELGTTSFTVHLIPFTQSHTTLGGATVGQEVNLEMDLVGKYVQRQCMAYGEYGINQRR